MNWGSALSGLTQRSCLLIDFLLCPFSLGRYEVDISGLFGDSVVSRAVFSGSCLMRRCFAKTDTWYFSGNCFVKGHVVFCCSRRLRGRAMFRKNINRTPQTVGGHSCIGSPCHVPLVFADDALALVCLAFFLIIASHDFIERNTLKNFWWHSGCFFLLPWDECRLVEPLGFFWIELPLLIHVWCFVSVLDC